MQTHLEIMPKTFIKDLPPSSQLDGLNRQVL